MGQVNYKAHCSDAVAYLDGVEGVIFELLITKWLGL